MHPPTSTIMNCPISNSVQDGEDEWDDEEWEWESEEEEEEPPETITNGINTKDTNDKSNLTPSEKLQNGINITITNHKWK